MDKLKVTNDYVFKKIFGKQGNESILKDFLKSHHNRQFSIAEIVDSVKDSGIGKSTVYRNMSQLLQDGEVRRFRGNGGKSVVYQYVGEGHGCNGHFHLKCNECGLLTHIDCQSVMGIRDHISAHHDFSVDIGNTIFYGLCGSCQRKAAAK